MVKKIIALGFLLAVSSSSVVSATPPMGVSEDLEGSMVYQAPTAGPKLAKQVTSWNEEVDENSDECASFKKPSRFAQFKESVRGIGYSIVSAFKKIFSVFSF